MPGNERENTGMSKDRKKIKGVILIVIILVITFLTFIMLRLPKVARDFFTSIKHQKQAVHMIDTLSTKPVMPNK